MASFLPAHARIVTQAAVFRTTFGSTGLRARFREAGGGAGHTDLNEKPPRDGRGRRRPTGVSSLKWKERISMSEKKNQCIHCCVESCRHLKQEQGICSLESIQVAPTPMAYSGDPADESMCQSYHCK